MEEEFIKKDNHHREMNRQYYQRELRSLELIAYAELISAVRASGSLDDGKKNVINFVRDAFRIPEERHKAEIRRVASDERLGLIADMVNGTSTSQGWADEGFTQFPTLPHIVKYIKDQPPDKLESGYDRSNQIEFTDVDESDLPKHFFDGWMKDENLQPRYFTEKPKGEDFTEFSIKSESDSSSSQSSESSSEDELPALRTVRRRGPVKRKIVAPKPKIQPSAGRGNLSPDITDITVSPIKREINRSPAKRGRGAKRKISIGNRPQTVTKILNRPSGRGKRVKSLSNPRPVERTSSGETPDEDIPMKRTKPDDEANSTQIRGGGRGRGLGRVRGGRGLGLRRGMGLGRGASGRGGRGRGAKRESRPGSPDKASTVASKLKIKLNRPFKAKIKKPIIPSPVGSRRKSKLKEKPIDDLIVEMRNYDDHVGRSFIQTEMSMKRINSNDNNLNDHSGMESDFDSNLKENSKCGDEADDNTRNSMKYSDDDISKAKDSTNKHVTAPSNNNNEDEHLSQNDKESSTSKSDSENSCSSFNKHGSGHDSPVILNQAPNDPLSEVVISSSGSNSNHSSSSSTTDDNEENENSSDTDHPSESNKTSGPNSQNQNQSSNSPIPLQSINSQQCTAPARELPSPPPIQKPIRHKLPAGINPSPGVIIQQPRNPLPAPVFSTSLNMSSFHKKRTKLIANNVADGYNLHLPPDSSASGVPPTVATASSLATRRPTIISSAGVGGLYSNNPVLTPSGRSPGILHQARKAHPHILSTSKAHRNFIPNSNSNTNNLNANNISLSTQSQSINVSSVSTNCISTISNSVQVQQNQNFSSATAATLSAINSLQQASNTTPVTVQNYQTQSGNTLSMANAIPMGPVGVARTQGTNIIFLQKASSSSPAGNPTTLSTNVLPVKNSPRAVILRRAQIPRQGNVMILDVQKNQIVNASQVPQFLQTRILSANPPDISMLNLPGSQTARKIIQVPSSISSSPPTATTITYPAASSIGLESPFRQPGTQAQISVQASPIKKARIFSQPSIVVTSSASSGLPSIPTAALRTALTGGSSNPSVVTSSVSISNCLPSPGTTHIVTRKEPPLKTPTSIPTAIDGIVSLNPQIGRSNNFTCPIEAELMAMERNDMYEEVVTSSEIDSSSNGSKASGFPKLKATPTPASQINISSKVDDIISSQHLENNKLDTSLRLSSSSGSSTSVATPIRNFNNEGGSSTDTASENESSFTSTFPIADSRNAKPIVKMTNSYSSNSNTVVVSSNISFKQNSGNVNVLTPHIVSGAVPPHISEESIQSTPITEDIFEAALKSSGIIFNDSNPFFDNEDEISTNSFLANMDSSQDPGVASQVEVMTLAENAE